MECRKFQSFKQGQCWLFALLLAWMMLAGGGSLRATPSLDNSSPVGFFTTCANLFLQTSGYNFTVTNIPIYPTNYYTPALHRLLQLSANLYDASTNRAFDDGSSPNGAFYPTVFRPTFYSDGTNVFINGYVEDISTNGSQPAYLSPPLALPDDFNLVPTNTNSAINIYGIPYVIGARKGFPNFNSFNLQSVSLLTRKVQLVRLHDGDPRSAMQTNIQYILTITNLVGSAAWNSYTSSVPRSVDIIGVDNLATYLSASNDASSISTLLVSSSNANFFQSPALLSNQWSGFVPNLVQNTGSFRIPLNTNIPFLANVVYHPTQVPELSTNATFDTGLGNIQPHFVLNMTNRLRFIMVDHLTGRIIDYVHFKMDFARDLTGELFGPNGGDGGVWDTSRVVGSGPSGPIVGVDNQIMVSFGINPLNYPPITPATWVGDQLQPQVQTNAIIAFRTFWNSTTAGTNQAPFTPTRAVILSYIWQANDPLVHYTLGDLSLLPAYMGIVTNYPILSTVAQLAPNNLAQVNTRYSPWNNIGNPNPNNSNATNLALKDPLIYQSDSWQFPTNNQLTFASLGSVHRGTPWQTVYLKSATVPLPAWVNWTGDYFANDAQLSLPTNDWNLVAALIPLLAPQDAHDQYGYNQSNPNSWAPAFQGLTVLTNTPALAPLVIDDAVNSNAIVQIVAGINAARNASPHGVFTNVAQALAAPQLSVASPFLNPAQSSALTDAALESIPSQLLPLLRPDSIGSLAVSNGPAQLQFTGIDGYAYLLQTSTNLVNWSTIAMLYPTNGIMPFTDSNQSATGQRFYRTALAP